MVTTEEILKKYSAKLENQVSSFDQDTSSKEYAKFKTDMVQEPTRYEKWAKTLGNIVTIKIAEKDRLKLQKQLSDAHVDVNPSEAVMLSLFSMFLIFLTTLLIAVSMYLINGLDGVILFAFLGIVASAFVFYYTYTMPKRLANSWRLEASSQMVPAVLYVVVYMKHTSNLERAIAFASEHLEGPLALDFKKIFYDVEIGKFSTIKQSLDNYLDSWRDYAPEFVESFHLIESSLFEPSESRRIEILEKSLQLILDGIYEKMLKFSREIRSPITNIYMLGIILPTLGLAMLPLASALLGDKIKWQHFMILFNVIIPFFVFYMTSEILLKRPGGYGETSILELNPNYHEYKSNKSWALAIIIALPLLIIGILPFLFQVDFITTSLNLQNDYTFEDLGIPLAETVKIFDFKKVGLNNIGPFGPIAALLSLFIPLGISMMFIIVYKSKTRNLINARKDTQELEQEFTNTLFQLGNRLGDGVPPEIAFAKVASSTQGQKTYQFFTIVNQNIQQLGMSVESAIFDKKRGAIIYFPSQLISTSMKILIESSKKGLQVAARSLMSISEYIKNIHKINARLKDLLAEIASDMSSNMTFLAPLLSGIVVGLGAMITGILNRLGDLQANSPGADLGGFGNLASITNIFEVSQMVPPYFLQVIIGVYIIEIIFILTSALTTIESGKDTLKEKNNLARNLMAGSLLYIITALVSITALYLLSAIALGSLGS